MPSNEKDDKINERVAHYRARTEREGLKRVETTVSAQDVNLIKDIASTLRAGGPLAQELRAVIRQTLPDKQAASGQELVEFLLSGPRLTDVEATAFDELRERSTGRHIDFE